MEAPRFSIYGLFRVIIRCNRVIVMPRWPLRSREFPDKLADAAVRGRATLRRIGEWKRDATDLGINRRSGRAELRSSRFSPPAEVRP
jgi:hypothetical protein